jgi:PAS domain S-box-containing protein
MQAHRRSEAALRDAQSILLAAQRLGATGSWEVDLVKGTLTWSEQVYRIFGRDPLTFTPTNTAFFEAVHEDDRDAVRAAARNAIEYGQPYHIEHRIRLHHDRNEIRHLQEHAEIVLDPTGRPVRMIGAVRDLTAHRLAEAELEKERTLLRTIIDAIPDSIYVKDATGHYILQNRANLDRHGLKKASDGLGKTVFDLTTREIAEQYSRDDWEIFNTGKPLVNREEPFITPQGAKGVFLTTKIAFNGPDGKTAGLVGISRDVTKLLRMAEERQQFERHLNDAARLESLGVLAGGIAHDFNNLLTGVLGNASLLRITLPPTHEALEAIGGIETAAEKAAELCRQMLAYAGKGRFVLREFELNRLIQQTTVLLRHSVSKKAEVAFHLSPEPIMVEGDETQLGQILMNLVINASEALEDNAGTITIRSGNEFATREYLSEPYLSPDLAEGYYAFVEVIDTGKGMTEELRAHIFEPFFTTKFAGRGLGLAAALGIVRSHHGALKVASTPGKGTAFRVLLPLKNRRPVAPPPPPPAEPATTSPVAARVLVIDDESAVRSVTRKMLNLLRCSVVEAADGEEGLAKFLADPGGFQIVMLDLTMPRLSGYQVSAEIWKSNPALPIVFMSGYNEEEAPAAPAGSGTVPAIQGPRGFLQKPFTFKALSSKLESLLGRPALPPR